MSNPAFRGGRKPSTEGIVDPNLTPLIDVSLVLVVILLVATPMALQSGIAVSHAATTGQSGAMSPAARVEITVLEGGRVTVNRSEVARESLGAVLVPLIAASPTRDVVVRCEAGVTHGEFVGVIDEAKAQGAAHVAVAGS
jgi:biopolymer transport protein ExbD